MTSEQFVYWLQGFSELSGDTAPTAAQWKMIQDHIALVLNKVTPGLKPSDYGVAVPYIGSPPWPNCQTAGSPNLNRTSTIC